MSEHMETAVGQMIQFEAEKQARRRSITFEYVERSKERLRVEVIDGVPHIVGNAEGLIALAKLLAQVGAGHKCAGLKLHLRENLDSEADEVLRIMVEPSTGAEGTNHDGIAVVSAAV